MSGLDVSLVPRAIACSLHYLPAFAFSTIYQRMRTRVHAKHTHSHTRTLAELGAVF
jgi:hypothetical protein